MQYDIVSQLVFIGNCGAINREKSNKKTVKTESHNSVSHTINMAIIHKIDKQKLRSKNRTRNSLLHKVKLVLILIV